MAISFVGGTTSTGTGDISLTSLSGGSDSSPSENDIVIVVVGNAKSSASYPTIVTSGFTTIADLYSNDSDDTVTTTAYKIMTSSPDTSISIGNVDGTYGIAVAVHVWRGIDTSSPFDVTTTTATGINSSAANPPSITPTTSGTHIIAIGANGYGTTACNINAAPSGYINLVKTAQTVASQGQSVGIASKAWTSGPEDPSAFGVVSTRTSSSWIALTIALKEGGKFFSISETLALTESTSNLRTRLFSNSETLSLSETTSALKGISFTIVESLGLIEAYNYAQTFVFSIIDNLGLIEVSASVRRKWDNITKSTTSWTNQDKNTTAWSDDSKSNTTWTDTPKS